MKKLIIVACSLIAAIAVHAQGTVNFNNRVTASGINAKITKDGVAGVSGSEGFAALYGGPVGGSLVFLGPAVNFRTGAAIGFVDTAAVDPTRVVPGVVGGQQASFEVRAWLGSATTWEAAVAAGLPTGKSATFTTATGGIIDPGTGLASTPADLIGLQGFAIPEPGTLALAGLGAASLLLRRRK